MSTMIKTIIDAVIIVLSVTTALLWDMLQSLWGVDKVSRMKRDRDMM